MAADYYTTRRKVRTACRLILRILGSVQAQVRAMKALYPLYMNPPIPDASNFGI
jgi:hypothetical protein